MGAELLNSVTGSEKKKTRFIFIILILCQDRDTGSAVIEADNSDFLSLRAHCHAHTS